ncbi:WhiB family transcriptional regulator [Streptomyces subrutilus]|uniref:Transcriptional regulator WhiB n=1 Tax=Streptomyces subrutilus TaxID=36818 RepID=A0A5P2UU79_9ACTN|nr:WhiB family transcriptional regulator [Streptomyces subrutilus]
MAKVSHLPGRAEHHWTWQTEAACRGLGAEVFFHPEGERGRERAEREEAAKSVCGTCPVRARCLEHALRVAEPYGVWGGLGEKERQLAADPGSRPAAA